MSVVTNPRITGVGLSSTSVAMTGIPSSISGLPKITVCYPEWFGAVADGVTDCTTALQACALFAANAGYIKIQLSPGTYKVTATVYANGANAQSFMAPTWLGVERTRDNTLATNIDGSSLGAGVPVFKFRGASGRTCSGYMDNIRIVGSGTSIPIMIQGLGGYQFRRMNYDNHAIGPMAHNEDASSFTEYVTCEDCDWRGNVTTAFQWKVTSGNNSFHGTGLTKRCTINASATGPVFWGLSGCNVYNAPCNAQVWSTSGSVVVFQNDTVGAPTQMGFVGELSLEVSGSNTMLLANGNAVYFAGPIRVNGATTGTGASVRAGSLLRVATMSLHADSSYSYTGAQTNYLFAPNQAITLTFSGTFAGGETSGTLTANWYEATGAYQVLFSNGNVRQVTLTRGATTATWSGALSTSATATATAQINITNSTKLPSNLNQHRLVAFEMRGSGYIRDLVVAAHNPGSATSANPTSVASLGITDSNTLGGPTQTGNTDGTVNLVYPTTALTFTGAFSGTEVTGTLSGNWTHGTGVFSVVFSNGDIRLVSLTNNATSATWTGGLSAAATTAATANNFPQGMLIYVNETQISSGVTAGGHAQF